MPRVWFNGDDVPGGVWVLNWRDEVVQLDEIVTTRNGNLGPLVEVPLPDYETLVRESRAARRCTHKRNDRNQCEYRCGLERGRSG